MYIVCPECLATNRVAERALEAEMSEHLGHDK
jgi:transposase-like protein